VYGDKRQKKKVERFIRGLKLTLVAIPCITLAQRGATRRFSTLRIYFSVLQQFTDVTRVLLTLYRRTTYKGVAQ
jgi:hypothetical protein